jgi:hypothetical protein
MNIPFPVFAARVRPSRDLLFLRIAESVWEWGEVSKILPTWLRSCDPFSATDDRKALLMFASCSDPFISSVISSVYQGTASARLQPCRAERKVVRA